MEILIVSKTRMTNNACVGGLVLHNNEYVRLLNRGNQNQPLNTDLEIGQIWDITFIHRNPLIRPHIEDIIVLNREFVRWQDNMATFLSGRNIIDSRNSIENTFDGLLSWTNQGSGYIQSDGQFPQRSVNFWVPDQNLYHTASFGNHRYDYPMERNRSLKFVGFQQPVEFIQAGSIVRLSLTRHFSVNDHQGYWLQLSGWYTDNPA